MTAATLHRPVTSWIRAANEPDPGKRVMTYVGSGHPNHLNNSPAPVFLSGVALNRYKSRGDDFPVTMGAPWAFDSGAYTALTVGNRQHPWWRDLDTFGGMVVRLMEDIGPCDFAAIPDWPCEPDALAGSGYSIQDHLELTQEAYTYLSREFYMVPWIPVLQGWRVKDYLACERLYQRAGVDLAALPRVGLGSVCRRADADDIAELIELFAGERGYKLHGFGVSIQGLRRVGHLLASTDSQAWSKTARNEKLMLPGCEHWSRPDKATGERHLTDCRNCFRYALSYREEMIDAIRSSAAAAGKREAEAARRAAAPRQLAMFDIDALSTGSLTTYAA